MERIWSDM